MSTTSFSSLALSSEQLQNLQNMGFEHMTPVQEQSLPFILEGQDVMAQAKTGSGKTLAFTLGILQKINPSFFGVQGLVLCPTRELAEQVATEIRKLARAIGNIKVLTLCGGSPIKPQTESLSHGAHIIVATPGRLLDHLNRENVHLKTVKTVVLDEADRMLDMGFLGDIEVILQSCPYNRHTLLFSATFNEHIKKIAQQFLKDPMDVKVQSLPDASSITQTFYSSPADTRHADVMKVLLQYRPVSTLIFCNTKAACEALRKSLVAKGFHALVLQGDMDQRDREDVLVQFTHQSCSILIATDVAARGLDISTVDAIINAEISPTPETHVHRIGRTGRADQKGLAINLCANDEKFRAERIAKFMNIELAWKSAKELDPKTKRVFVPPMRTICVGAGKKHKLRPGDLLGALTGDIGLAGTDVGKITLFDFVSFVAVRRELAQDTIAKLSERSIKGKSLKMRFIGE